MKYIDGYNEYFPEGYHDSYFNRIEFDYKTGCVGLFFESIVKNYIEVELRFFGVNSLEIGNVYDKLIHSSDINDIEITENEIQIYGIKGWNIRFSFINCEWYSVEASEGQTPT